MPVKAAARMLRPAFAALRAGARLSPWPCPRALTRPLVSGQAISYAYSAEEDAAVLRARAKGVSYKDIGIALGRPKESVRHRYKRYLCQDKPRRKAWTSSEDALILKKRADGATWTEIAAELGKPRATVNLRYLNKLSPLARAGPQSTLTPTARRSQRQKPFTTEENHEILRLIRAGAPRSTIATQLGRPNRQIYAHISAHSMFQDAKTSVRKFNKAEVEWMLELHLRGYTREQISQALGRTHIVVSRKLSNLLADQGETRLNREWDTKDAELASGLCAQGCTVRQIALKLRRSHSSVKSYLTKTAVQLNVRTPAPALRWTKEERQKLVGLYSQNLSWKDIASQFPDRTRTAVQSYFYNRLVDRSSGLSEAPLSA